MDNARCLFLKPILRLLMSQGYSATFLATNIYPHESSHGVAYLSKAIWNEDFQKKRLEFLKQNLIKFFRRGYETYEMDKLLKGVPWEIVNDYISEWWGSIKEARIHIVKYTISKMLSKGVSLKDIAISLKQDSIDRLRKQISLFWGFRGGQCLWGAILKFVKYIKFKKLSPELVYYLNYASIKEELKDLRYLKFLNEYEKNPNMELSKFKSLFPNLSKSTYYNWKNKADKP